MNADEKAIASVLREYELALNESDTEAVLKLYVPDGVFMPQHFPSSIGAVAVRKAYQSVFQAIQLTVKFGIAEIKQLAPDWAFARTNSAGTVKVNSTGEVAQKPTRNSSSFRRSAAIGRSLVIVFRPPTHRRVMISTAKCACANQSSSWTVNYTVGGPKRVSGK